MFGWLRQRSLKGKASQAAQSLLDYFESDDLQNEEYPEPVRRAILSGSAVNRIEGATGAFGFSPTNPIPVNGSMGEVIYISCLRTPDGLPVIGHRVATVGRIDAYEVISIGTGQWDLLFFDPYHPRKSRDTPEGFTRDRTILFSATNQCVDHFPQGAEAALRDFARTVLGNGAMIPDQIKAARQAAYRSHQEWRDSVQPKSRYCTWQTQRYRWVKPVRYP